MQETKYIWRNGKFVLWQDAMVHVLTHALHYGSGAFEGIRVYKTNNKAAIFRLPEHIDRLIYSAKTLEMILPYSKDELIAAIKELVNINELHEGYIRPLVFSGYGELGVHSSKNNPVEIAIACWPWGPYHKATNLDIKTSQYIRLHPKSTVVDAKICGHYVNSMLAVLEIQGTKYHEVLMLDYEGYVAEGSSVNIFVVKNNVVFTPTLGTILAGITRDFVIKFLQDLDINVIEKKLTPRDLLDADEVFFVGTAAEVTGIRSLDDQLIGTVNKPLTEKIRKSYQEVVRGNNSKYLEYLTLIDFK